MAPSNNRVIYSPVKIGLRLSIGDRELAIIELPRDVEEEADNLSIEDLPRGKIGVVLDGTRIATVPVPWGATTGDIDSDIVTRGGEYRRPRVEMMMDIPEEEEEDPEEEDPEEVEPEEENPEEMEPEEEEPEEEEPEEEGQMEEMEEEFEENFEEQFEEFDEEEEFEEDAEEPIDELAPLTPPRTEPPRYKKRY